MSRISEFKPVTHEDLPGVVVYPLGGEAEVGRAQEVLVEVDPLAEIPLHKHKVDATMIILGGEAEVLSEDTEIHGQNVTRGKIVFFEREVLHGFKAGTSGLLFISKNGGIVDSGDKSWDMTFA